MRNIVPLLGVVLALLAGCVYPAPATPVPTLRSASAPDVESLPAALAGGKGFAVYLTADGLSVAQMQAADLSQVRPATSPIISGADILAYRAADHALELAPAALERLRELRVPVNGVPFLVCQDGRPVYWGAFWTPLSSLSFDRLVIWPPMGEGEDTVHIGMSYP